MQGAHVAHRKFGHHSKLPPCTIDYMRNKQCKMVLSMLPCITSDEVCWILDSQLDTNLQHNSEVPDYLVPSFRLTFTMAQNVAAMVPMIAGRCFAAVSLVLRTCMHDNLYMVAQGWQPYTEGSQKNQAVL